MRVGLCGLVVILITSHWAVASEVAGTWEGTFADAHKSYAGFDLDVSGNQVTGEAYLSGLGFGQVTDGRVDGDRFTFTVNTVTFEGRIEGDTMSLASSGRASYSAALQRTRSHVTGPISAEATAKDLEGKWTARFVGRIGDRPKMIGRIDFGFIVEGNTLTGVAHMDGWPGDCPITDVRIDAGRISFTATGRIPSSTGIPVFRFEGEIHGNQLKLTMRHQIFGADNGRKLPMDVSRR